MRGAPLEMRSKPESLTPGVRATEFTAIQEDSVNYPDQIQVLHFILKKFRSGEVQVFV